MPAEDLRVKAEPEAGAEEDELTGASLPDGYGVISGENPGKPIVDNLDVKPDVEFILVVKEEEFELDEVGDNTRMAEPNPEDEGVPLCVGVVILNARKTKYHTEEYLSVVKEKSSVIGM
ncbi:hypothetical protein FRC19_004977 [Serendipita sp. 401]|nr:hypothetical protein FRC19_004977 [Serendipita sp. 401]KAG9031797.1 hypothetical protein FS842_004217 [Serendipita sp. 407]